MPAGGNHHKGPEAVRAQLVWLFLPEASQSSNAKLGWMQAVYFLSGVRTPIGKFGGSLASLTAADMGVVAAKAAIERAGVQPSQVEETIFGNARQAGGGPNPARQISDSQRRPARSSRLHRQQSLRFGNQVHFARLPGNCNRKSGMCFGGRNRVHVALALLSRRRTLGITGWAIRNWWTACTATAFSARWRRWSWAKPPKYWPSNTKSLAKSRTSSPCAHRLAPPLPLPRGDSTTNRAGHRSKARRDHHSLHAMNTLCRSIPRKAGQARARFLARRTITAGNSSGITDGAAALVLAGETFVKQHNLKPLGANCRRHLRRG